MDHFFIFQFHREMLASVEEALSPEPNYYQEIGGIFLKYVSFVERAFLFKTNPAILHVLKFKLVLWTNEPGCISIESNLFHSSLATFVIVASIPYCSVLSASPVTAVSRLFWPFLDNLFLLVRLIFFGSVVFLLDNRWNIIFFFLKKVKPFINFPIRLQFCD